PGSAVQVTANEAVAVPPAASVTVRDVPPVTLQLPATPDSTTVWLPAATPVSGMPWLTPIGCGVPLPTAKLYPSGAWLCPDDVAGVRSRHGAVAGDAGELDAVAADAEPAEGDAVTVVDPDRLVVAAVYGDGVAVAIRALTRRARRYPQAPGRRGRHLERAARRVGEWRRRGPQRVSLARGVNTQARERCDAVHRVHRRSARQRAAVGSRAQREPDRAREALRDVLGRIERRDLDGRRDHGTGEQRGLGLLGEAQVGRRRGRRRRCRPDVERDARVDGRCGAE